MLVAIAVAPLPAQSTSEPRPYYNVTEETTINGTVSSVLTKAAPRMVLGSHLLLQTATGQIDASLGPWGLAGKDALVVSAGKSVEVTGVMKTLKQHEVFVVRTVKVDGEVYPVRNEHGVPISPQARQRASQNGGSL
jgi:hypothetical protein